MLVDELVELDKMFMCSDVLVVALMTLLPSALPMMLMLANRVIWENESEARKGGDSQDRLLKFTHSINGVRNTAKNIISYHCGERRDLKVDCFAESLAPDFGCWQVFEDVK